MVVVSSIAHVKKNDNDEWVTHELEAHLRDVAQLAAEMAKEFDGSEWARLAGLWHDLGKYRSAFQNYIRNASGYDPEAHIEQGKGKVDHSTAGAAYAIKELGDIGRVIAYLIAGHHAGLPDWNESDGGNAVLEQRLQNSTRAGYLDEALANNIPDDILKPKKFLTQKLCGKSEELHLKIRMLFSCLVDADFLDTELFMSPDKTASRNKFPSLNSLKIRFDNYMQEKISSVSASSISSINQYRAEILQECRDAANSIPGVFTLTVPTGGGKTLASMAFALEHAIKYDKQRIIVAIPYTSIIEQTAEQYREIFGDAIIEHHSNLDPELAKENSKSRLATENWDAPIIVTTNVQLLESLFAARTSRCRKLHNLVNSIIIIDEAQLLPPNFLQPVVDVLRILTTYYKVTIVLTTATQPVLTTTKNSLEQITFRGLDNAREIIQDVSALYQRFSRVKVEMPKDFNVRQSWGDLAEELLQYQTVLVIVNTRKDCRELFDLMPSGTCHLSGLMCGEHRSQIISDIKNKLKNNMPVRVISTQLVEAGVDLDFPIVYRALGGLDSIAQAAGRCNREGKLEWGKVVVFVPPKAAPRGMLMQAEQATISVCENWSGDPLDHHLYQKYFTQYFNKLDKDSEKILPLLTKDASYGVIQFRTAAQRFQIIDETKTMPVLVPYTEQAQKYINTLRADGPERYLSRLLQRYTVTLYKSDFEHLKAIHAIEEISLGIYAVCLSSAYDSVKGLLVADELYSLDAAATVF